MELFAEALATIADIMQHGAASHPDNDWVRPNPDYHVGPRARASAGAPGWRPAPGPYRACRYAPADGVDVEGDWLIGAPRCAPSEVS